MNKKLKICCISSHGGHLHELRNAMKSVNCDNIYWVTYQTKHTKAALAGERHYFIIDPVTNLFLFGVNALQSLFILFRERPDVVVSTGAGMAFPTMYLAKKLFRAKIIFIESAAAAVEPSKTGRIAYKYADLFLIQWESLKSYFPNAVYTGGVL